MSAYHGVAGDVTEFDDADDAQDLISGEPATIGESSTAMAELGAAMTLAGRGLSKIDASGWTGCAADNFRARIDGKPQQWQDAGTALEEISQALTTYRLVLDSSQSEAGRALHMWKGAQASTKKAITEHNERVKTYNAAIDAGGDPGTQPVYQDPGEAGRKQAEQMLEDARRRVTDAGYACGRVISEWIGRAPAEPDWWDRLGMNIADAADYATTGATDLVEGVWEGVKGINSIARLFNPFDPYNLANPGAQLENMGMLASGLWTGIQNPQQFISGVLDTETWKDSPGKALGKLLPDVALGVLTGGSGLAGRAATKATVNAAVDTATGGLWGLGQAGVGGMRKVGTMLGREADNLGQAAQDASRAGRSTHTSDPSTTPLQHADSNAADMFDQIGKTVTDAGGDLRRRIDDLAAWSDSRTPDTTTSSSVTPTPEPPIRTPSQVTTPTPMPQPVRPAYVEPPVTPPPDLRPVQSPPEFPKTPPPPGTRERATYDIGQRIQRSIEDSLKFKADMRAGFPTGNGHIPDRLAHTTPDPHPPTRHGPDPAPHPREPEPSQTDQHPEPDQQQHDDHQPEPQPEHHPLADNVDVRADVDHSAAVKTLDLSTIDKDAVWRTTTEELHRVDSRSLDDLFEEGLQPRNENLSNIHDMIGKNSHSGWVSTSRNADLWENHGIVGLQDQKTFSVLSIDARGGVDVEASWEYVRYLQEAEIAFPGGVDPSRIRGGYSVRVNPDGTREIVPDSWRDNPYYQP